MTGFLPDSNCIIAVLSQEHPDHQPAIGELARRLNRGEPMILASHALLEAYSVLTRLPALRGSTADRVGQALDDTFIQRGTVVALMAEEYQGLLLRCWTEGILGGTVYDALIAACAEKAQADTLLTFNERHFRRFASPSLQIVVPTV